MIKNLRMAGFIPEILAESTSLHEQLLRSIWRGEIHSNTIKVHKNNNVYLSGDDDRMIYLIEKGQVKRVMYSLSGKECILAIHCMGDVFGESCLAGAGARIETAMAMENTILKQIPSQSILRAVQLRTIQVNDLIRHLVKRNLEQELFIVDLLTLSSEFRLGKTLLLLAYKLGEERPSGIAIPKRIIQEELSQMIGTTRPRVSEFLQKFRQLGLIELSAERFIIIKEENLANYLLRAA